MNMTSMKRSTMLAAAVMLGVAAGAGAAEAARPATATEATAPAAASVDPRFAALDTDGDGSLLQGDLPDGHDLGTDLFAAFDTNQDQRISSAEYSVYAGGGNKAEEVEAEEEEAE